jgi:hypothetical protein
MICRTPIMCRLPLIVAVVNLVGIACFYVAIGAHVPRAAQSLDDVTNSLSALDSIGFTLMLPGIFFATITLLWARFFAWSEEAACAVWYASAFVTNLFVAWKVSQFVRREVCGCHDVGEKS